MPSIDVEVLRDLAGTCVVATGVGRGPSIMLEYADQLPILWTESETPNWAHLAPPNQISSDLLS
jgi:hypothetical protein